MSRRSAIVAAALLLAACVPETPAPAPTHTSLPEIAASPTVVIRLPEQGDIEAAVGRNDPTAAAVPSGANIDSTVPLPPSEPFQTVARSDGLRLSGWLFRGTPEPTPAVLLLHMLGGRKEDWLPLVTPLQMAGYTVLVFDLRGSGETGGAPDWALARQDVADMMDALRGIDGVDPQRLGLVGASIGANLALNDCAVDLFCQVVAALSPGLDYRGVTTEGAVAQLGDRPLLLVAGVGDVTSATSAQALDRLATGPHEMRLLDTAAHGTDLLTADPALLNDLVVWLDVNLR